MEHKPPQELIHTLVCADCGMPIADSARPRSDVTRYLAESSRCQCNNKEPSGDSGGSNAPEEERSDSAIKIKISMSLEDAETTLGERYEVLEFLGKGGMGSVFKIRDRQLDTVLAVKILNPDLALQDNSVKRFEREAKASMQLTDPHLAAVYSYGIGKNQTPYLVMDFLEGRTLETLLKEQTRLDPSRALTLFIQICEGLAQAHSKGVIHRDIKPSNVMVTEPGGIEFAKVFDFGIAKVMPDQAIDLTGDMTRTGELFGSPLYMAPEQFQEGLIDQRTDIHALGCLMYKTLAGTHPFEGKNVYDTVSKIISAPAGSIQQAGVLVPPALDWVILRCLEKDPAKRFSSARELQSELEKIRDGKKTATEAQQRVEKTKDYTIVEFVAILVAAIVIFSVMWLGLIAIIYTLDPRRPKQLGVANTAYQDPERLDQLSYTYFSQGKYELAIPLLEFGIGTYKANGKKVGIGRDANHLAESLSHLGKCYLRLKQYSKAVEPYRESLKMFQQWGNYKGGGMTETVNDYAEVLRGLNRQAEAEAMLRDYQFNNNLTAVP